MGLIDRLFFSLGFVLFELWTGIIDGLVVDDLIIPEPNQVQFTGHPIAGSPHIPIKGHRHDRIHLKLHILRGLPPIRQHIGVLQPPGYGVRLNGRDIPRQVNDIPPRIQPLPSTPNNIEQLAPSTHLILESLLVFLTGLAQLFAVFEEVEMVEDSHDVGEAVAL